MTGYEVVPDRCGEFDVVYDGWLTIKGFSTKKAARMFIKRQEHEDFYNVR